MTLKKETFLLSIFVSSALIIGSILSTNTQAQGTNIVGGPLNSVNPTNRISQKTTGIDMHYEFGGKMIVTDICCNGIMYRINEGQAVGGGVTGSFIFPWQNMIPVYQIGIGLYQYWQPMTGKTVAGDATKSGQCQTIVSYCNASINVDYTTWKMGTILRNI